MNVVGSSVVDCAAASLPAVGVEGAGVSATAGATPELASGLVLTQPFIELLASAAITTTVPAESAALPSLTLPGELPGAPTRSATRAEKSTTQDTAQDNDALTVEDVLQLARDESAVALLFYPLTPAQPASLPAAAATVATDSANEPVTAPATDTVSAATNSAWRRTLAAPQISMLSSKSKTATVAAETDAAAAALPDSDSNPAKIELSLGSLPRISDVAGNDSEASSLNQGRDASTPAVIKAAAADVNALAALAPTATRASTDSQVVVRTVAVPVHHPQWAGAVAAEVRWCVANSVQSATLRLVPEHLGPVEIRVDLQDSQVNVNFSATHADTRTALEASMPRLRDMLAGAGLSLGQASVQQESGRGSQNSPDAPQVALPEEERAAASRTLAMLGLVDEYA